MIVFTSIADNGGTMFNKRRVSKDKLLRERMFSFVNDNKLFTSAYGAKQFDEEEKERLFVSDSFLNEAGEGDFCFSEDGQLKAFEDKIEKLIVFRWNRDYPADTFLDVDLKNWKKESTYEFAGNSHEKITEEVYVK